MKERGTSCPPDLGSKCWAKCNPLKNDRECNIGTIDRKEYLYDLFIHSSDEK